MWVPNTKIGWLTVGGITLQSLHCHWLAIKIVNGSAGSQY
jgi:hypothetical protein